MFLCPDELLVVAVVLLLLLMMAAVSDPWGGDGGLKTCTHDTASAPACAIWASSVACTPDTPMPPTILPSTTIGMPPSISVDPRTVKYFNTPPPLAMSSSIALVGRRNSTAVRALPSAILIAARCEPSRRCSITAWQPLSTIEITTLQLFCVALASAAAITFFACSSVIGGP